MNWLALDIGGANLKAADGLGFAAMRPFAIWRAPQRLAVELEALIASAPACDRLAVTMTAELADCYETKAAGVRSILDAVESAAKDRVVLVYLTDGRLASIEEARKNPLPAAASNWHALASFANRVVRKWPALLMDMGSTTTDIIPLGPNGPRPIGVTDAERLLSGELAYTGVARTPVSAIVRHLPWRGRMCPIAAELFATSADIYVLLGDLAKESDNVDAADGRPRTRPFARARLARMICADSHSFSDDDARLAAASIQEAQLAQLEAAVRKVVNGLGESPQSLVLSGQGEFLLRQLTKRLGWSARVASLSDLLGPNVSQCAPAHALAVLARERPADRTGK